MFIIYNAFDRPSLMCVTTPMWRICFEADIDGDDNGCCLMLHTGEEPPIILETSDSWRFGRPWLGHMMAAELLKDIVYEISTMLVKEDSLLFLDIPAIGESIYKKTYQEKWSYLQAVWQNKQLDEKKVYERN